jgi:hypothetical protein
VISIPLQAQKGEGDADKSSQVLVVLPEPAYMLPDDEDVRWDALNTYNILDTVRCR